MFFKKHKEDLEEAQVFRSIVISLDNHIKRLLFSLDHGFSLKPQKCIDIMTGVERLGSLIELYINNKYSSPAQAFNIDNELCNIKTAASNISGLSIEFTGYVEQHINGDISNEQMDVYRQDIGRRLGIHMSKFEIASKAISFTIQYDLVRIYMGIDLVKEFKEKKRRYRKPRKKDIAYTFTYVKQPTKRSVNNDE